MKRVKLIFRANRTTANPHTATLISGIQWCEDILLPRIDGRLWGDWRWIG